MSSPPPALPPPAAVPPQVRRFPAPCWTQEETLALISAYQDKWYSLRRRNLRTADWDAVAEEVTRRCPDQSPAKSSVQCRHKMEKLRKRYRTEKQRILNIPNNGRFLGSSWFFFDLMDSMELGSGGSNNNNNHNHNLNVNNQLNNNNNSNNPQISHVGKVDPEVKLFSMNNNNNNNNGSMNVKGSNSNDVNDGSNCKKGDLGKYFDEKMLGKTQNHEFDVRSAAPHIKFKVKNQHHNDLNNDCDEVIDDYNGSGGGFKRRKSADNDEMFSSLNGCGGGLREMVSSIKMLGEGLVKMEKMKMEMMKDIEKMRMEMEMKRSEMILQSQHLIINAFVEGLKKNKKVKVSEID